MMQYPEISFEEHWQQVIMNNMKSCKKNIELRGNVLIVTDHLLLLANHLAQCFTRCTFCNVLGVVNNEEAAKKLVKRRHVDFLIFAGTQYSQKTYNIKFSGSARVTWSTWDPLILNVLKPYSISYHFEKFAPLEDFFHYLQTINSKKEGPQT